MGNQEIDQFLYVTDQVGYDNTNYYNTFATKFLPTGHREFTAGNLNTIRFTCSAGGSAQCYY